MARPKASELTERELEVMQAFWDCGDSTVSAIRDRLASDGRELAYTTVATLIRILTEKGFIEQTGDRRPFTYSAVRSFEEVSGNLLRDLMKRVFGGNREQLLLRLIDQKKLSKKERELLESVLREGDQ